MIMHPLALGNGAYSDMVEKAMKILALDTALDACSVAVVDGSNILAEQHEERARGHAERLIPMIKDLLNTASISFDELDLVAVSVGPGTFTGLRIGLAAARGISLASSTPCLGITTLETLAASVTSELAKGRPIVVVVDARRKEVYFQTFNFSEASKFPLPTDAPRAIPLSDVKSSLPTEPFVLIGSGAQLILDLDSIENVHAEILSISPNPKAHLLAAIAQQRGLPTAGGQPPAPVYLRAPDAKLPGGIDPAHLSEC